MTKRELSTKWYNVIRRQIRNTPITYVGPIPTCPNCGGACDLLAGRYGRYYLCLEHACGGIMGARLDGTPRKSRVDPETAAAQERIRWLLHQIMFLIRQREAEKVMAMAQAVMTWTDTAEDLQKLIEASFSSGGYRFQVDSAIELTFTSIFKGAGLPRKMRYGYRFLDDEVEPSEPLRLKLNRRTPDEVRRIEAAALVELRKIRRTSWDRILLDIDAD